MIADEVEQTQTDDEFVDEDVYTALPEHGLPERRLKVDFQPWHHPRKQYVRIEQWCAGVRALIPRLSLQTGDPFRYLTLPGNELLDVRALHGVCERAGINLRYLGFNSVGANTASQSELALSQSEVLALSNIDRLSMVLEDRLESVVNSRSVAFKRTEQGGPFHAINLDLCDALTFREIGGRRGSPLEAMGKLLELQVQSTSPWLLFVTTKAEPALVAEFAREGFMRAVNANAEASSDFRQALADLIAADLMNLDEHLSSAWQDQDQKFLRIFCTGLGKWLLGILAQAAPPRDLELLSSCYYQSGPAGPDMLSLAFLCSTPPMPLHDPSALLPSAPPSSPFSEVNSALKLAAQVANLFDLDAKVASAEGLAEKLIKQSTTLLASARYDADRYGLWARDKLNSQPAT